MVWPGTHTAELDGGRLPQAHRHGRVLKHLLSRGAFASACCLALWCGGGCGLFGDLVSTRIVVKSSRQSLREQVLGAYAEVGREVYLLAGVRSVDPFTGQPQPPRRMSPSEQRALEARRSMEFNRDDVLRFKRAGYVGEGRDGLLVFFTDQQEMLRAENPWLYELVRAVALEENRDRLNVMQRIIEITPELQGEGGPDMLRAILAEKSRQEAELGMKLQRPDSVWETRAGAEEPGATSGSGGRSSQ